MDQEHNNSNEFELKERNKIRRLTGKRSTIVMNPMQCSAHVWMHA